MSNHTAHISLRRRYAPALVAGTVLAIALALFSASAAAAPEAVPAPVIPGAAALPGPIAPASQPAATMGLLRATPDRGVAGTKFTLSGTGLPAGKTVSIVWQTAKVTWVLDARPDTVDYLGQKEDKIQVVLATTTVEANGTFSLDLKAPRDFGGIHDVYAVVDGIQKAKGGFLVDRTVSISPKQGPIGTRITVKLSGLGSSLYGSSGNVYWDGKYGGVFTGKWTRGEATVQVRAAGPVGRHTLVVGAGMQFNYLNYQQSPIPWATGGIFEFKVTKDAGPPPTKIDWPLKVAPTVSMRTTLSAADLAGTDSATMKLDSTSGPVLTKVQVGASGLVPSKPAALEWSTVVGNRVNCVGTCWTFASVPLGNATAAADGTLEASITVPDGLGGWHVIRIVQGGEVKAQIPYYVKRSVVSVPKTVKAGKPFQIHLKGVGWTQLDNTVAVTYDNGYVGYGCGFNSDGDVVLNLVATGGPGTHLIDIYPLLYTYQPAYPYPPHNMVPFLSFARDEPGLALGYQLPAMRLAINVVA
jgi:hypothetical protein